MVIYCKLLGRRKSKRTGDRKRAAEETAIKQNCHGAYLYTYSFQSPKFYEKFGYEVSGKLKDQVKILNPKYRPK